MPADSWESRKTVSRSFVRSTEFTVAGITLAFPEVRKGRGPSATGRCSVLPRESRHVRQERRNRRRTDLAALERLESRELMAFSSLGFSLPQLVVTGTAGPRASWGGTLNVSVYLQNIGASTTTEPTAQAPGDTSQADAGDSTIAVVLTPHAK